MTLKNRDTTSVSPHRLLARIDEREQDLREELRRLRSVVAEGAADAASLGDPAGLAVDRSRGGVERELIERHLQELAEIERARERLAIGAYGTCVECGEPIGHERLRAVPSAKYCTACQAEREKTPTGTGYPR